MEVWRSRASGDGVGGHPRDHIAGARECIFYMD